MLRKILLTSLLLVSCGRNETSHNIDNSSILREVRALYMSLIPVVQDEHGYVETDKCDSVLHTALLGAGKVEITNMNAARNASGQWFRRPLTYTECLSVGASKSTFSRDMVTGLLVYWQATGNWQDAEAFYQYASDRSLKFGESDGSADGNSRIFMSTSLMALLAEVIYRNGGPEHLIRHTATRLVVGPTPTGFEAHLQVLQIVLWGRLTGYLSDSEKAAALAQVARSPQNALFQYAAGNLDTARDLLLAQHPHDRLPTSADICNPLQYETDNWVTCPEQSKVHPGTHFMLISGWLLKE